MVGIVDPTNRCITVVNLGDSRAILCHTHTGRWGYVPMSNDHKPYHEEVSVAAYSHEMRSAY